MPPRSLFRFMVLVWLSSRKATHSSGSESDKCIKLIQVNPTLIDGKPAVNYYEARSFALSGDEIAYADVEVVIRQSPAM